jgi:hypothetical protein
MTALRAVRESQWSRYIDEIFMKPFENGSTVKLTDRYAKTLEKARGNPNWSVG